METGTRVRALVSDPTAVPVGSEATIKEWMYWEQGFGVYSVYWGSHVLLWREDEFEVIR